MSHMTEEKKEALIKRYGSQYTTAEPRSKRSKRGASGSKGPGRGMAGAKPKDAKLTIRRLFAYLDQDKLKMFLVFICVLISAVTALAGGYILRPVINNLADPHLSAAAKANGLLMGVVVMALIYLIGVLSSYLQMRTMMNVSESALYHIREDLFHQIQRLSLRFHDTHTHGEIMSRFTNDLDVVSQMLSNTLPQIFSGVVSIIGTLVLMFYTNWILALLVIVTAPGMALAGGAIAKRNRLYFRQQQQSLGAVNGYIEEIVTGQKVVKVFCHEDTAIEEFDAISDDLHGKQIRARFFGGIMGPVMGSLSQVSYALAAVVGGILCLTANFDIGGLTIFTNYARQFARPINELSMQVTTIFSALAGAERVFEVMDADPETPDPEDAIAICSESERVEGAHPIKGRVTMENVSFGYTPGKPVLKSVNVTAEPGQKVAFVGSTGAGKTTITNLINRFYDMEEGKITIDGIDIRNIRKDSLRSSIAMVLQDTHLFSGTVMENIRYGRLNATDDDVIAAAKVANAHSFIERLENGYQTMLKGDGANLSQGQRQLLNIARASISKAPILILDEATSSVDTRTEKHIEQGMDHLMENRTTFIIAHRLSTVRNADKIIVLEHGGIVEQGTHEELLARKGRYYQLYTGKIELD